MASEYTHTDTRPILRVAKAMMGILVALIIVDIGMLILSILALIGAGSTDDRQVVQEAVMDFPPSGRPVQSAMIALAAIGLASHATAGFMLMMRIGKLRWGITNEKAHQLGRFLMYAFVPSLFIGLIGWAVCLGFQTTYVPLVTPLALLKCHHLGPQLVQCGMISATWIGAMVYCIVYSVVLIVVLVAYYRLQLPPAPAPAQAQPYPTYEYQGVSELEDPHRNHHYQPPPYQIRPPSYQANDGIYQHPSEYSKNTLPKELEASKAKPCPSNQR